MKSTYSFDEDVLKQSPFKKFYSDYINTSLVKTICTLILLYFFYIWFGIIFYVGVLFGVLLMFIILYYYRTSIYTIARILRKVDKNENENKNY